MNNSPLSSNTSIAHLSKENWDKANRRLIKKTIGEFTHEKIFEPILIREEKNGWAIYKLTTDFPDIHYRFEAIRYALDHWHINEESIDKWIEGSPATLDVQQFIIETKDILRLPPSLLPTYLEEITSTLNALAYKTEKIKLASDQLIHKDFQTIEHSMTEGHPCFVANHGRLGFDSQTYDQFAPEANQPFHIFWIAAHRSKAAFHSVKTYDYQSFIEQELDAGTLLFFRNVLLNQGLNPDDYIFMPVHPWQWKQKISTLFAHDIARRQIVWLGPGPDPDQYVAQQSVRTLFNRSHPKKHYVKTALSILNMGFVRGLSPYYMESTPRITEWIDQLLTSDPVLSSCSFEMLREVATVGYRNTLYEPLGKSLPHNKMLAALWRESPLSKTQPHQQLMTMAALLHVDHTDRALVVSLIKASGLPVEKWISSYLQCYLKPLIHCFYKYELVFMPHGENLILAMENHVPVKAIMKDITEEVIVFNKHPSLTGHAQRLYKKTSDEMKLTYIFTDVFDNFFRFLSGILASHGGFDQDIFWQQVSQCIQDYQEEHPELEKQYLRYNFFQETFQRCCLNRLQLKDTTQMLNLEDPFGSLQWEGIIENPLFPFRKNTAKYVEPTTKLST